MGQKMPRIVTDSERIIVLEQQIKKIIADHDILQACVNAHAEGTSKALAQYPTVSPGIYRDAASIRGYL